MVFHIDEDAYEMLRRYLQQLEDRFEGTEGSTEIIADIEYRLAEIFREHMKADQESVSRANVEEAIGVLGNPEEIGEMAGDETAEPEEPVHGFRRARRMYRDTSNRVVGGVCSGLGEYMNVDPVIFRILFVVFTLTYGVGILVYLLLWIAIPEARTRAEKMEMRGENINIASIERSVRREFEQVKTNLESEGRRLSSRSRRTERRTARQGSHHPRERSSGGFFHVIGQMIVIFFKIIGAIIGFSLVVAGLAILVAILGILISGNLWFDSFGWNLHGFSGGEILNLFLDESVGIISIICLVLLIAVPVLGLIYGGVKLLFRFHANDRAVALSSTAAWVVALVVLSVIAISEGSRFSNSGRVESEVNLNVDKEDGYIYLMAALQPDEEKATTSFRGDLWIIDNDGKPQMVGTPRVDIEPTTTDGEATIRITRISRGSNLKMARESAKLVEYSYVSRDTLLMLDPVYRIPQREKFQAQEVEVEIQLPVGTRIYLDESLRRLLYAVDNTDDRWSRAMVGEYWVMTESGLSPETR